MTSNEIMKSDLLDILFQDRNKSYGAYALRRGYNARLAKSLGLALGSIILLLLLVRPGGKALTEILEKPEVKICTVALPVEKIELPKPARLLPPPPPVATTSLTSQVKMVDRVDPIHEFNAIDDVMDKNIGSSNVAGDPAPGPIQQPSGSGITPGAAEPRNEEKFVTVEVQPEFPGGQAAWMQFLQRYLQTPSDLAPGEKRTVMVNFIVDAEGVVTGFKVTQSAGTSFDNEVIRVLKKMPRWKPAIQNGHNISVSFTQPVSFVGSEE